MPGDDLYQIGAVDRFLSLELLNKTVYVDRSDLGDLAQLSIFRYDTGC